MKLMSIIIISFISAALTLQAALKNGFIGDDLDSLYKIPDNSDSNVRFNCQYAGLWCTCYTNNNGGCSVGCSPNTHTVLYNQTYCPQIKDFILSGFVLVSS